MSSTVEQKAKELLEALQAEKRSSDWETRLRMFAGNDTRILRRIPLIRRLEGVQNSFSGQLKDFIHNLEEVRKELN